MVFKNVETNYITVALLPYFCATQSPVWAVDCKISLLLVNQPDQLSLPFLRGQ